MFARAAVASNATPTTLVSAIHGASVTAAPIAAAVLARGQGGKVAANKKTPTAEAIGVLKIRRYLLSRW